MRIEKAELIEGTGGGALLLSGRVFTTGAVAKICKVAPRTVSKWFDSGRLGGYRIPGSNDRRVPEDDLLKFMRAHGLPVPPGLLPRRVLAHGLTEAVAGAVPCPTSYDLGREVASAPVTVLLVGDADGGRAMLATVAAVRAAWPECRVVAVLSEDAGDPFAGDPLAVTFHRPGVDWDAVAGAVLVATVAGTSRPGVVVQCDHHKNQDLVGGSRGEFAGPLGPKDVPVGPGPGPDQEAA